jgi:hypothetical protein
MEMRLSPCRFKVPLMDNAGRPVEPRVILDLQRELRENFEGFTVNSTSQGHWQSQAGRLYEEEIVGYEVAIPEDKVSLLRDMVCRIGVRLGQLAMYFDAPAPPASPAAPAPLGPGPRLRGFTRTPTPSGLGPTALAGVPPRGGARR